MSVILFIAAAVSAEGPDLTAIDRAVARCDAKVMTATFADEPQRRRAFAIAAFEEQQEIVAARQALGQRRLLPAPAITPLPVSTPVGAGPAPDAQAEVEHEAQRISQRQQALDDARMLGAMRDSVLDLMRQHYLSKCAGGKLP